MILYGMFVEDEVTVSLIWLPLISYYLCYLGVVALAEQDTAIWIRFVAPKIMRFPCTEKFG